MRDIITGMIFVLFAGVMYQAGWVAAHNEVVYECRKIEAFYVGSIVVDCLVRKENVKNQ